MKLKIPELKNTKIEAIIFDLGAVILNIDYHLAVKYFSTLGLNNFDNLFAKANQSQLFNDFEKGLISSAQFRDGLRDAAQIQLSDTAIDNAWNSMLLDLPLARFELLLKLKNDYPLYLLSNTNQIHIAAFTKYFDGLLGVNQFESAFEKVYYSSVIHLRKPDAEIFEFVLNQNNLNPATTLFIDDSPQHIKGALNCGLLAFHLNDSMDITQLFE